MHINYHITLTWETHCHHPSLLGPDRWTRGVKGGGSSTHTALHLKTPLCRLKDKSMSLSKSPSPTKSSPAVTATELADLVLVWLVMSVPAGNMDYSFLIFVREAKPKPWAMNYRIKFLCISVYSHSSLVYFSVTLWSYNSCSCYRSVAIHVTSVPAPTARHSPAFQQMSWSQRCARHAG